MRYLQLDEVIRLHRRVIEASGGGSGIRDLGLLESAVSQPLMAFGGVDLYPTILEKAAALAFSLALNHPFVDGNKRVAHASLETFLLLNGFEIGSAVDEQESVFLRLAAGELRREELVQWLQEHMTPLPSA